MQNAPIGIQFLKIRIGKKLVMQQFQKEQESAHSYNYTKMECLKLEKLEKNKLLSKIQQIKKMIV